jgi:hypothetical protein
METVDRPPISTSDLALALRAVDARVVLVPARVLRRVIRGSLGIRGFFRHAPRWDGLAIATTTALLYADRDELGLTQPDLQPDHLILVAEPEEDGIEDSPGDDLALRYWRTLFHARVHLALEGIHGDGATDRALADRIEAIGRLEFNEARSVLVEDSYLTMPTDDRSSFVKFAANYLEGYFFRPDCLRHTFPAIRDHEAAFEILSADLDPPALFEATRLTWTPGDPASANGGGETEPPDTGRLVAPVTGEARPESRRWKRLRVRAELASQRGNCVRAAILQARAAREVPEADRAKTAAGARAELDKLSRRLRAALGFDDREGRRWREALPAFLDCATLARWSPGARMLYDLQKIVTDHERPISALDPFGWIFSLGGHPLKRPLPDLTQVRILKHLQSAGRRVSKLHGLARGCEELESLIEGAIARQESSIRERFRERIRQTLEHVSLRPANLPEETSRRKIIEELLDLIIERGYLRIGDLRDAISRNQNKLPDLSGPREFLLGDPLLRADAELARSIEGVYHRGEIYLRGLQRASSLAFGTRVGRWLTRYIALPVGASFVALEGLQHIVGPLVHLFGGVAPEFYNPASHAGLALILVGVFNFPTFRVRFLGGWRAVYKGLKSVFFDIPAWVFDRPAFRTIVNSRTFELAWNWVGKPLLLLLLVHPLVNAFLEDWHISTPWERVLLWIEFVLIAAMVNSRPGRLVEEIATDGATRIGQRVWRDLVPALFRGVMDFFKAGLEATERLIYTVDEWLRFRSGDGRLTLAGKVVVGMAWAVVAYVARIYVNLLIEPQINPIKHFPVVTVSHKIILTASPQIFKILRAPFMPLGAGVAAAIAGPTLFLLPGVFGFLVWEFKENWRLYAANRSPTLRPVPFGHHGETMSRLLRRGFHSGTVPKLYYRLRKADRKGAAGLAKAQKKLTALHHVEDGVRRFVERGVIYLLERSRSLGLARPFVSAVHAATNRIVVEISEGVDTTSAAVLAFEEADQRLTLRILEPGWLAGLESQARTAITSALVGLCALSDVDAIVNPEDGTSQDARLLRVSWSAWVATWEDDVAGRGHPSILAEGCRLLPERFVTESTG